MGCCCSSDSATVKRNGAPPPLPKKSSAAAHSSGHNPTLSTIFDASSGDHVLQFPVAKKAPRVIICFYSTYGHCFAMARAAAKGAASAGAHVALRRIAETLPISVLEKMHAVEAQKAFSVVTVATPSELANYDAILIVTPTRFGSLPTQVRAFLDATGQLWLSGALTSKVGGGIVSSATQHGGQETTFRALRNFFLHQGMIVTGLSFQGMMGVDEIKGGSPYGATTITGGQGERMPSAIELEGARVQGAQITGYAAKLIA